MIFTSRYSNPELKTGDYTVVGITRGAPKFPLQYQLAGNIIEFAPPGYLFNEYDRGRFTPPFFRHLDKVGVPRAMQLMQRYIDLGKPVVFCCYKDVRKPGEWCHRLVFAEWWESRTGELIEELKDPSPCKWAKPKPAQVAAPTPPPEPDFIQERMW